MVITWLFSHRPVYQAQASTSAQGANKSITLSAIIVYYNMLKVTDEWLIVCCGVYTALTLALAATTRDVVNAHDVWKFQTKLRPIEVLALISAPGISTYSGSSLMITARCYVISAHLQAMYPADNVDRMILCVKTLVFSPYMPVNMRVLFSSFMTYQMCFKSKVDNIFYILFTWNVKCIVL